MKKITALSLIIFATNLVSFAQNSAAIVFDVVIKNAIVYDGSGGKPYKTDIGISGDKVVWIRKLDKAGAISVVDAMASPSLPVLSICCSGRQLLSSRTGVR